MGGRVGAVPVLFGALSSENWGSGVLIKKKIKFSGPEKCITNCQP